MRGITAAQAALLPELAALDLPHTLTRLDTPIVMAQGRHDQVAPPSAAERYAELLEAPSKQLVWFERSAHMPHLEEPERFRELLAQVRLGLAANHDPGAVPGGSGPTRRLPGRTGDAHPGPATPEFNRRRGVL
jgi:pimeloyl-ACP methyl ester carboxylesterase